MGQRTVPCPETDARGNVTEYTYNAIGALTQVNTPVSGLAKEALLALAKSVNDGGIVLCETHRDEEMPKTAGPLTQAKEKTYGRTKVTVYRKDV